MERDFLKSLRAVRTLDIDLRVAMDEVPTGTPFKLTGNTSAHCADPLASLHAE